MMDDMQNTTTTTTFGVKRAIGMSTSDMALSHTAIANSEGITAAAAV